MESSWHDKGTEAKLSRVLVVEIEERPACKSSSRCNAPTSILDMLVFEGAPDTTELLCGCSEISSNPFWSLEELAELIVENDSIKFWSRRWLGFSFIATNGEIACNAVSSLLPIWRDIEQFRRLGYNGADRLAANRRFRWLGSVIKLEESHPVSKRNRILPRDDCVFFTCVGCVRFSD